MTGSSAMVSVGEYRLRRSLFGKKGFQRIRILVSYVVLFLGACFMLFPMLWMLSASFKPEWQIFTRPPIWLPVEWIQAPAGKENVGINTYRVRHDSATEEVIRLGRRRYTTVIGFSDVEAHLQLVPASALSDAQMREVKGVPLNVRQWSSPDGVREVVALAKVEDSMAVIAVEDIQLARVLPLTAVNSAKRARPEYQGITFQGREVEIDGQLVPVLPTGPESELVVVSETSVTQHARLVHKEDLGEKTTAPIGATELDIYTLKGDESGQAYVVLSEDGWFPVLELDVVVEHAFTVPNSLLTGTPETYTLPNLTYERWQITLEDGTSADVIAIQKGTSETIVLPVEYAANIRLGPISKLAQDQDSKRITGGGIVRFKERFDEFGKNISVALVGPQQTMLIVIPLSDIPNAYEVDADRLERNTRFHLRTENYRRALTAHIGGANFLTFFKNSAVVVALNMIGNFLSCTIVAYAFARLRAPGKSVLFGILLSTMMLPFPVTLIPVYEIFRNFGMIDTLYPLFLRSFFGNAFFIFLLRQFFMTIPVELEEAARIDGANRLQILMRIILPLSMPALATMAIFTFLWSWNDFFTPYVFINSPSKFTATLGLNLFKGHFTTNYEVLMAASVVVITPTILIFFFLQRYFIEGIQLTGLKG